MISERGLDALIEPDILASFQYFDRRRQTTEMEPEKTLMAAVLEDAIDCYKRYATARNGKGKRLFAEAEVWLMEEDGDWLFSFANICAILGLSSGLIRAGLLLWKRQQSLLNAPRRRKREMMTSSRGSWSNCPNIARRKSLAPD